MFDWISQYSTNFSWISCRETEVFGAKTVLTPGRCHQGRKSHQRVRGWQGVHEFQEITLDIIDIIIGTYRKAAPHETTRVWILYVGVFLLLGRFQHLFLTRVVSTTYFLLKTRAHEIQYWNSWEKSPKFERITARHVWPSLVCSCLFSHSKCNSWNKSGWVFVCF